MKKSIQSFLFALVCHSLYGAATPTHEMIILLDYLNEEAEVRDLTIPRVYSNNALVGAMTSSLLTALYQKAAPLLVSRSLVNNVYNHKKLFHEFTTTSLSALKQKYGPSITFSHSLSTEIFKRHCSYTKRVYAEVLQEIKQYVATSKNPQGGVLLDQLASNPRFSEQKAPPSLRHYKVPHPHNEMLHKEMYTYLLCAYAPFNSTEYLIKKVSNDLLLFIPHTFIQEHAPSLNHTTGFIKGLKEDTPLEKSLGIRINHFLDVDDIEGFLEEGTKENHTDSFVEPLSALFIEKAHKKTDSEPRWVIYLSGHGLPARKERVAHTHLKKLRELYVNHKTTRGYLYEEEYKRLTKALEYCTPETEHIICSLPLSEFKKLLHFFEKIPLSLLFYNSCFAGGEHLTIPYKKEGKDASFSYDVIVGTISDSISLQDAPMLFTPPYAFTKERNSIIIEGLSDDCFDLVQGSLIPYTTLHFDHFFTEIKQQKELNYQSLIALLHPYVGKQGQLKRESLHNTAHLRKAFSQSFTPLITTSPFEVLTRNTSVSTAAEVFLLAENHAPELSLLKKRYRPSILSLLPGQAWHTIPSVKAPYLSLTQLISCFLDIPDLATAKLFWIKEVSLDSAQDLPPGQSKVLKDVIITRNVATYESLLYKSPNLAYFTDSSGITRCIIRNEEGSAQAVIVSHETLKEELYALFPGLKKGVS